jgi:hypothetical protein
MAGQRHALRLRQEAGGEVIGALTAQLRQVDPSDCGWVLRSTVEAFSDLAARHRLPQALEVSRFFAAQLSGGLCCDKQATLRMLGDAYQRERVLLAMLPAIVPAEDRDAYARSLHDLGEALEQGRLQAALRAQGMLAVATRDL